MHKVWLYAPGENASKWDVCLSQNIMCIGWDEMGNLLEYASKKEMAARLQEIYDKPEASFKNDSLALWEFAHEMQAGDIVIVKKGQNQIIVCEKSPERIRFVREHYPDVLVVEPENCKEFVIQNSEHGGADVVLEVAGSKDTFRLAWECARPNAVVTIVALYDEPQILPLPDMYGKNLIFKTGGVDGCDCAEILNLIEEGKIDTTPLITHRFPLNEIEEAYRIFENKLDGVIKVAIYQ